MSAPAEAAAAPVAPAPLKRTALHPFHLAHGAHLMPFAGWEMPRDYTGVLQEHRAVRSSVGLFDVSHMGVLTVIGGSAARLLSRRTTANVAKMVPGQCRYAFLLDSLGKIVDDLLVTRLDDGERGAPTFLAVPNAANATFVFELLRQHRRPDTEVRYWNPGVAILAVQGPRSRATLESIFPWSLGGLRFYHARAFPFDAAGTAPAAGRLGVAFPDDLRASAVVSRTGYTGELGYELFVAAERAVRIAEKLVAAGVHPCGLVARDTLRLEKGYLLSGQDFHLDRTPLEAGQDRFVELDHPFVGREEIEKQRAQGLPALLAGISVTEPGAIPRVGTPVLLDGAPVTLVTSGGLSPTLGHGIALAYLPPARAKPGTELELDVRGRRVPARVASLPFVPAARPT